MNTQLQEKTKRDWMIIIDDPCKPMAVEIIERPNDTYVVKWMLTNGEWNQVAIATKTRTVAGIIEAELKAGLRNLQTGELLDEGTVPSSDPSPAPDVC